jgi:hypothetical protein
MTAKCFIDTKGLLACSTRVEADALLSMLCFLLVRCSLIHAYSFSFILTILLTLLLYLCRHDECSRETQENARGH